MTAKDITTTFRWEQDLVAPVARFLRNRTFRLQKSEVPFYEYRIDIYGYSHRQNLTVAVELKLKKWSRAMEQALLYQLCSDLVYIAMPRKEISNVNKSILRENGVGLIAVEEKRCQEILKADPSSVLRKHYRKEYLTVLQGGE